MGKHAYLIIAHNNWDQLHFLISLLNDPRNDFFILIDAKARHFDTQRFISSSESQNIFFVPQIDIRWGSYSLIEAELMVLKSAISHSSYDYYHLLSGVDMPLKSQRIIHDFFDSYQGTEFVDYDKYNNAEALDRARYHYFLQTIIGRKRHSIIKYFRDILVLIEKLIGINRVKDIENDLGKGSAWFSITDNFARYVISNEAFIKKHFADTYCCDEVFLQTLLNRSPYKKNWFGYKNPDIYYSNLRYMDWTRGKPYTFTRDEFEELTRTPYLFARKFGTDIIDESVNQIICH